MINEEKPECQERKKLRKFIRKYIEDMIILNLDGILTFVFSPFMFSPSLNTRSQSKARSNAQSGFLDSKTNKTKKQESNSEDLSDRLSKTHLSPPKDEPVESDILEMFGGLSMSELEIDISTLLLIIDDMKSKSLMHITMKDFVVLLDKFGAKKENKLPSDENRTPPKSRLDGSKTSTLPNTAGGNDSISSSVNSSWSSATVDSPPLRFNFKTPQKIFNFPSPSSSSSKLDVDNAPQPSVSLFADPPEDGAEPPFPPAPPKVAKFLFPSEDNEGKEADQPGPFSAPAFNIGATSKPLSSKLGAGKVPKGKLHKTLKKPPAPVTGASHTGRRGDAIPQFNFQTSPMSTKRMSADSTDNEMEESTSPVQDQSSNSAQSTSNGFGVSDPVDEATGEPPLHAPPVGGFKAFSLGVNKAVSAKKKRAPGKGKTAAAMKDLDAMFANIKVNPPPPPPEEASRGNACSDNTSGNSDEDTEHPESFEIPPPPAKAQPDKINTSPGPSGVTDKRMADLADMYKNEGKRMYTLQRYDMAFDAFSKALQAAPRLWTDRANVLSNRAAALIMMERIVEAIEDCEEAARIDPNFIKVHTRRGRALLKLGMLNEATDAFVLVLGWQPPYSDESIDPTDDNGRGLARQAMKQVLLAKTLRDRLAGSAASNAKQSLQTADELLQLCPFMRQAQAYRARAMCQLHQWNEAKTYMEYCVCAIHTTMQKLSAHPSADLNELSLSALGWHEVAYGLVRVDMDAVRAAFLSMGPFMARIYLIALKNQDKCRSSCSADVMAKLSELLGELSVTLRNEPLTCANPDDSWDWVILEQTKLRLMISAKNDADEKFRSGLFENAIQRYTDVLQVDPDAHIWNAIMFGNRAASSMRLGLFSEAVSDCHQSLVRDPEYTRAYLRRARANRALGNHSASVRDYKKYLNSNPIPNDASAVEEELREVEFEKRQDDKDFDRFAPGWTGAAGRASAGRDSRERESDRGTHQSSAHTPTRPRQREEGSKHAPPPDDSSRTQSGRRRQHNKQTDATKSSGEKVVVADVMSSNFYLRLGVSMSASEQQIKTAYRKMALKFHPDKNKADNAAEMFKSLTEAYTILSDKIERRNYDESVTMSARGARRNRR